ncbi:DUF1819 family protein (plasmid) [Agrobacterium tumefaciens]|nr:DUF1819 family protein [Agrobacterium tumefaciens]
MQPSKLGEPYKMSFVTGGLFINESLEISDIYLSLGYWPLTRKVALEKGVTSLPKAASRIRALREIVSRLSKLTNAELQFFSQTKERANQKALLWLAVCREYRFIGEFATEVVRERFASFKTDLPLESFDSYLASKAEWNEGLAKIRPATSAKLRQVLFRIMREADIVSQKNEIRATRVSASLLAILTEHSASDLEFFPGFNFDGERA